MQTILASDNGTTFIGKLNSNFEEINPSQATQNTVSIPLIRGGLEPGTGQPQGAVTTPSLFTNKVHSTDYIKISGTLVSATATSGTVSIYCFDGSFTFLGAASGVTLVSGTKYIRVGISSDSAFATIPTLTLTFTGELSFSKSDHAKKTANFFCFETVIPKAKGTDGNYSGSTGIHYDQGFIKLPPNYKADGAPVPLVLYFPGSNGYQWGETSVLLYDSLFDFICDNGYAIACCSGLTDYWMDSANNPYCEQNDCKKNSKWNATVAAAFLALYDYVEKTYNVRNDGVRVFGKSSGGMGSVWFSGMQPIKVRCAGLLAPSTFMCGSDMRWGFVSVNVQKQWQLMLGCPNYADFTSNSKITANSADAALLVANVPYYKQWEPFTIMSDIDLSGLMTECAKVEWNQYDATPAITSLLSGKKKDCPAPIKIWQAQDDEVIDWGETNLFVSLVNGNNGLCELRQMPSGTGKHHSVDTDANAPKCDYETPYNGTVNIPVAYAELVDWFNRW